MQKFQNILLKLNAIVSFEFRHKSIRPYFTNSTVEKQQQINNVEIIGTIHKHLFTQPSGYRSFLVLTKEPKNQFLYHMIGTRIPLQFRVGQRVRFVGYLNSQNKWNEQNELRQKVIIKANEAEILTNDSDQATDKNEVILKSEICSEIENTVNRIEFTVATKHIPRGGRAAGISLEESHRIIVYDKVLLDFVRKQLEKSDRVEIQGKVRYKFDKNSKGEQESSGYILANQIKKESK
ncbi:uncharacterized protein LOC116345154 [Contarinia nasturtii]|uniref:uncharacterized protein LOC116345154 n=1 Tax=Contarinia nasturtii TaxID=265458 RepID=UPI0012D43F24|nr:uncharacterized protein LOC116345154 [Contarinia nasturtii]